MAIDLKILTRRLDTARTILLFGAGSSVPSGGPTTDQLVQKLSTEFKIEIKQPFLLSDLATIIEHRTDRRALVEALAKMLRPIQPTGGILNLPDFEWAGLYTTNYDEVIERSFQRREKRLIAVASNHDFSTPDFEASAKLYKLHGTITCDRSLGHQSSMVISASDYDDTAAYREALFGRLAEQLMTKDVVIIGYSLGDPDLKKLIEDAIRIKKQKGAPGRVSLLIYSKDDNLALIYESRGLEVCFGGIDEFFAELTKQAPPTQLVFSISDNPLDQARSALATTISVSDSLSTQVASLPKMFNGSPASYADIANKWTFSRTVSETLEAAILANDKRIFLVVGAAGVGKTTAVRKALVALSARSMLCWEHRVDLPLPIEAWKRVDDELCKRKQRGVLFIDDAHHHLYGLNQLADCLSSVEGAGLSIVVASNPANWNHRLKSPSIFKLSSTYEMSDLDDSDIDSLLLLLENSVDVAALVEQRFMGFGRTERRRRLVDRCKKDMFVCMRNIFGFEAFDDIVLREYADLQEDYQSLYKKIAGMEAAGVRVHRQLALRTTGLQSAQVQRYLEDLKGIIDEEDVNVKDGVYVWRVRHSVIADIIASRKLDSEDLYYELLNSVVDNLNPSYPIEIQSLNEICDYSKGLGKIYDRNKQNVLLRKMITLAPRERVPRHRLITNLISQGEYDLASSEIRTFENELSIDGPVQRYKVRLLIDRAQNAKGLMSEDQASMAREAATIAEYGIGRFRDDKNMYSVYLDAGVASFKYSRSTEIFDRAMKSAKEAYSRILDPDLARTIRKFERIEQRFT